MAAPRFGIVGQTETITYRLVDQGVTGERAKVAVRRDGEVINERTLLSGQTPCWSTIDFEARRVRFYEIDDDGRSSASGEFTL